MNACMRTPHKFKYTYLISPAYALADIITWAEGLSLDFLIVYGEVTRYHSDDEAILECCFQTNSEDAAILFKLTWMR